MRRLSIVLFFVFAAAAGYGWYSLRQPPKPMDISEPVRIHQGIVVGGINRDNPAIREFNGIPYATAERWKPPAPPPQWGATSRDAREFGPECLQPRTRFGTFVNQIIDGMGLSFFDRLAARIVISAQDAPAEAEDCLFLNVRTANIKGTSPQPVMVWLHGGAHQYGSGSSAIYQSNGLVEKGVVLVTVNYRLGAFGYLAHPALTEEAGTSGNYGLLDQAAALAWVSENIAAFGGDPSNVTVFGESAGAQSITELMALPAADGLFQKVILQSGASTGNMLHLNRSEFPGILAAEEAGAEFLSTLAPPAATAKDLRAIPAAAIISRSDARADLNGYFLPVVDGRVLPRPIGAAFRDGDVPKVAMLAGYNADEGSLFYDLFQSPTILSTQMTGTLEQREKALAEVFGQNPAKALQALYGMDSLETWDKAATDMLGDDMFGVHMRFVARQNAQGGAPTYLYHFTRVPPSRTQTIGAYHAAEISFVFDSHFRGMKIKDADRKLTDRMGSYWTNFARTGDPNGDGLPAWPASSTDADIWMELDATPEAIEGLRARKLDILEEALRNRIDAVAGPPPEPPPPPAPDDATIVPVLGGE
ncbi:MAG: carboxylesterase family protein [Hyphomonas sp.]|uniref:carboxylesterase/lipase family protein n=1 Tax=Hyphomonas sp. TaxID=87 RepID=UPI00179041E5|nr:carboxylesterase family protein [Hyphomonas sp.]MBA3067500.1 carboxylesterase family protein [Hyphomonas sp.]MBU4063388.1 carboxylesterase family protein [Alphaproteobacteria bacterium]MBU4568727.1 carboxylesterase family protein [Alphaproteobacteria bacterium]